MLVPEPEVTTDMAATVPNTSAPTPPPSSRALRRYLSQPNPVNSAGSASNDKGKGRADNLHSPYQESAYLLRRQKRHVRSLSSQRSAAYFPLRIRALYPY